MDITSRILYTRKNGFPVRGCITSDVWIYHIGIFRARYLEREEVKLEA